MTDPTRLSRRAVAASALAVVLAGASFAPAAADKDKGDKDGKGGKGRSEQAREQSDRRGKNDDQARQRGRSERPAPGRSGGQGGQHRQGGGSGDPAGNNGTFKVDGPAYDSGMDNEPHVSCEFRLLFFGFDDGQTGDITISGHAPSGSGVVSARPDVLLSDDPAGGGPNDPDAVVSYSLSDLNLSGLTAHDKHGYHLKVTVATGEPGGVKHKVFWLEPCDTAGAVGGTSAARGTGRSAAGAVGAEVGAAGENEQARTAVLGTKFTREGANRTAAMRGAEVLGTGLTRGPALAYTGSFTDALLALAAGLLAMGAGLLTWASRPRGKHAL